MTTVVIEAPDQLSEYAVATLLKPDSAIRVLPAAQRTRADVLVIVASSLTDVLKRRGEALRRPCVLILEEADGDPGADPAGVLLRSEATPELLAARIRQAARGAGRVRVASAGAGAGPALDERERTILRMLAEGLEVPEIATRMNYSEGNVKRILSLLMNRLGLSNRWQAVAYAFRADLI
ncbi:helix-turn-helix transcriptional regulator [Kineosporia succinea]|uniref:DNA-binding CsgD family transcriptional regulator n=1 Tax=Kineosporia succinea TaxID=84632 RepID=A0ABT9PE26_9ACTN|nr:LuxR C-terminal-related transcriptional regulator [Kineosporia succinea]MDP9830958.1 DNA-binding CsgD family transcriptional regulator [Kineosporia succinea]